MADNLPNRAELQQVTLRVSERSLDILEVAGLRKPKHIEPAVIAYAQTLEPIAILSTQRYIDAALGIKDTFSAGVILDMMPTIYQFEDREYPLVRRDSEVATDKVGIRLPRFTVMTFGQIALALGKGSTIATIIEPAVEGFSKGSLDQAMARLDNIRRTE